MKNNVNCNNKKRMIGLLCVGALLIMTSCGGSNSPIEQTGPAPTDNETAATVANEDYFEWDGNIIVALTDEGAKQSSLVIPERCEGFYGSIFANYADSHQAGYQVESVSFESDDDIALDGVFCRAFGLKSVTLPQNLTSIGYRDLSTCTSLERIEIPSSVMEIESFAFSDCTALQEIVFDGTSVEIIGSHAFENCVALTNVIIPEGVEVIDEYAFYLCENLTEITLSDTIQEVRAYAFAGGELTDVYIPEAAEFSSVDETAFLPAGTDSVIAHVVEGSWADLNFDSWGYVMSKELS